MPHCHITRIIWIPNQKI